MMIETQIVDEEILIVTINRPNVKNAVDRDTAEILYKTFKNFEKSTKLKIAILQGSNQNFCSGADLKALSNGKMNKISIDEEEGPMGPSRMLLSKPVIGSIEGYALAGGLELACWCDLRIIDETTIFSVSCRRFGVPLIDGGTVRLPRLIGMSRALDMILTGRPIYPKEALEFGLANRIAPKGKTLEISIEIARNLIKFPQECLKNDRMSVYENFNLNQKEAIKNEFIFGLKTLNSKEYEKGSKKFVEKNFKKISKL